MRHRRYFWIRVECQRHRRGIIRFSAMLSTMFIVFGIMTSPGIDVALAGPRPMPAVLPYAKNPDMALSRHLRPRNPDARPIASPAYAGQYCSVMPRTSKGVRSTVHPADPVGGMVIIDAGAPNAASVQSRCVARFLWPVMKAVVTKEFDPPEQPWLPGHRGVDLETHHGDVLIAPADGMVVFAGLVAGKSVISVRHGELTSTFEPASTALTVGTVVRRGEPFAVVQGESDHCEAVCVHWGVKRHDDYLDPVMQTAKRHIVLKRSS